MSISIKCDGCDSPIGVGSECYCDNCYFGRTISKSEIKDIVYDLKGLTPRDKELRLKKEFERLGITYLQE